MEFKDYLIEKNLINEEVDVKKVIKDLINTNWSGSNEEQLRATQLLKGLATSEDPLSNKFMKALDKATSNMSADNYVKEEYISENSEMDPPYEIMADEDVLDNISDDLNSVGKWSDKDWEILGGARGTQMFIYTDKADKAVTKVLKRYKGKYELEVL